MTASAEPTLEERRALAENLSDPLNRYYRYPAARALLHVIGSLPLRPDHITYIHTLCGITAAVLVGAGDRAGLVAAFFLCELRMVLDCYDGVLARAKKLSSPRGRTIDELGDAVAYVAITAGMCAHVYRTRHELSLGGTIAFGALLIAWGGMSGHAYDFYNRRLGAALKDGRDAIKDELDAKLAIVDAGNAPWITRFGIWFDRWQVRLYTPTVQGNAAQRVIERANTAGMRGLVRIVSLLSWDNVLTVLTVGILLDRVYEVQLFAIGYGLFMFTLARLMIGRVLGDKDVV
ncbi:MAG: hypothetical protein JWP97_2989 [Labilithrix sp.]|nr:hypothetical protein [Labilithrix sp.]